MLAAEAYKLRLEKGLSFIEFNYQLLQAYDYLHLFRTYGCTLQMGGDDQWGNILAGVDLIRRVEGAEVQAMTFPLLTTSAGPKWGRRPKGPCGWTPGSSAPTTFTSTGSTAMTGTSAGSSASTRSFLLTRSAVWKHLRTMRSTRRNVSWPTRRRSSPTAKPRPMSPGGRTALFAADVRAAVQSIM